MSDNTPITQELRDYMKMRWSAPSEVVLSHCDNIDAIHKALEEQNAKLHEKMLNQRKQLTEVQEAIERRNNGVLKRRWQKKMDALKNENEEMRDFNSRVREAIRRHEDLTLWGTDYTALPLDADEVPIHVGDEMQSVSAPDHHGTVYRMELRGDGWWIYFTSVGVRPTKCRHYHEPTVADVLREFADGIKNKNADFTELAIAEYAKRLQLAEVDE